MRTMNNKLITIVLLFCIGFVACEEEPEPLTPVESLSIIETMLGDEAEYSEFVKILTKAGLINRMENSEGTFTIFAPTNAAINEYYNRIAAMDSTVNANDTISIINQINGDRLSKDFAYHLVSQLLTTEDLQGSGYIATQSEGGVGGNRLSFYYDNASGSVRLNNDAIVTLGTTTLSNGIIHRIDKVMDLPKLNDFINFDPQFSDFKNLISQSGEADRLNLSTPQSLLAPCNIAFDSDVQTWLADLDAVQLNRVLLYHILKDTTIYQATLSDGIVSTNIENCNLPITIDSLSNSFVVSYSSDTSYFKQPDIFAVNGVLHPMDKVLNPSICQ